ncbi:MULTISPECIES: AMP-dependent synthetase/ligase [unclassified Psychrobacter]|uniref:AMP-dependent synthetase/ligase n=1 Tax=unclassified Psychrobacter TaxID=196806 RepID=UPI003FD46DF5
MTTSIDIDVNTKNNTSLSPTDAADMKVTSAAPVSSHDYSENHDYNTGRKIHNAPFEHAPQILEGCDTLSKLWRQVCLSRGDRIAHREKSFGIWQSYSWLDYYHHSCDIGMALVELGLSKGDTVSILSEDNKEWLYFDMGVCGVGGIPNGVYTTDSPEQLAYILNDSHSKFLIVENDEQLHKFLEIREQTPNVKKVIVLDRKGLRSLEDDQVVFLDELYTIGRSVDNARERFSDYIDQGTPNDIRTLIYTSGTTGNPKGAILTHANVLFELKTSIDILPILPTDEQLCFLPLCHVLERLTSVDLPIHRGCIVNFAESTETVFENMKEVSPDTFTAVPRLWEKMYASISNMRSDASAFNGWAFDQAIKAGHDYADIVMTGNTPTTGQRLRYEFWNRLVLYKIRDLIGMSNIRRATTGAAPISLDIIRWFHAIGVPIYEGYGMTESAGVISVNTPEAQMAGSVGKALPDSEVRIADNGEILVRGANVFAGYWNKPEKTAEDLRDGWLHTGDVGEIRDGYIFITGRIKDIIITAGGKNVTPAAIESKLKFSPYISDAVVIGDKRKYLTCLIMIDQENVEKYAQDNQVMFSDFRSLCHAPEVIALIDDVVQSANETLAQVETIKQFRLIDVLLSPEDDELTATMKLKRNLVEKKHHALIDSMY